MKKIAYHLFFCSKRAEINYIIITTWIKSICIFCVQQNQHSINATSIYFFFLYVSKVIKAKNYQHQLCLSLNYQYIVLFDVKGFFLLHVIPGNSAFKSPDEFKVSLPLRTNYLYGKIKKTLPELYAFTVCLWLRSSASPGIGTPFSYAVPGQANEIVLIEWGNNPIELLINDKVRLDELFIVNVTSTRPDPLVPLPWLLPSLWQKPLRWCCSAYLLSTCWLQLHKNTWNRS